MLSQNQLTDDVEKFDRMMTQLLHDLHRINPVGMDEVELTESQCLVGMFIQKKGNCTMSEIANELGLSMSAITGTIDRMAKHGDVERFRDDTDRRLVRVQLTEKGNRILERIRQHIQYQHRAILEVLSEEDRATFFGVLQKIIDSLQMQKNQVT